MPRNVVHRARISQRIDTATGLVIVRGVAGTGKTVAAADWATTRNPDAAPGVWLSVQADTATQEAFWRAVLLLCADASIIGPSDQLHTLLSTSVAHPRMLRHHIIRGLAQHATPLVLVVDNAHLCEAVVVEDIIAIVEASPLITVVAITAERGTFDSNWVELSLEPTLIRNRDLLFTPAETAELLVALDVADPDGSVAEALRTSSGGLAVVAKGVVRALQREGSAIDADAVHRRVGLGGHGVFNELWGGDQASDRDVYHLVTLSIAETLTEEIAQRLTGSDSMGEILDFLAAAGMGSWTDGHDGQEFRFETRMRDSLRRELEARAPEEYNRVRGILMRCEFDREHYSAALGHAVALEEFDLATDIIIRAYSPVLHRHRAETIAHLSALSRRTLARQPLLAMTLALAYNAQQGQRMRALEMFAIALTAVRTSARNSDPVRRAVLQSAENAALRISGTPEKSLAAAERTARLLDELTLDERDRLEPFFGTLFPQVGLSFFYGGEEERALEFFEAARALRPGSTDSGYLHGLALSAGTNALHGNMDEAQRCVDQARREVWPDGIDADYTGALYQVAEAMLSIENGDYSEALARVELMAPHLDTIEHWPLFMYVQSAAMLGLGRPLEAATVLERALRRGARPQITPVTRRRLDAVLSLLLLAAGHPRRASAVLKRHDANDPTISRALARAHLVDGNPQAARAALVNAPEWSPRTQAETLLLRATAAFQLDEHALALDHFERAVLLLNDRGLRHPFALLPAATRRDLLCLARDSGRLADYEQLLADLDSLPALLPAAEQAISLTDREVIVLAALRRTASTAEIAAELFVSVNTIKSQLRSIYRKLGVNSRDDALQAASRLGLYDR
ncbi:hypothetical protein C2138_12350 [Salinibacterium hongtaonis]|nr:hypothetical protein C2138_12350 [Salinibacterium hongtaonis]